MTINFILNGEDMSVDADAGKRLVDILRSSFNLCGTKTGCCVGTCGSCSVIFNGEVIKSCLVPAFKARNSEIITIEGFSQTDEYSDIVLGFMEAELVNCGFCNSGKILTAEALLGKNNKPTTEEILFAFQGIRCRCTSPEGLVRGIMAVIANRRRRLHEQQ